MAPEKFAPTWDQMVVLTRWMADNGHTADQVAYAVEKPWKHVDLWALVLTEEQLLRMAREEIGE